MSRETAANPGDGHDGSRHGADTAPGDQPLSGDDVASGIQGYLVGLGLATLLTLTSFAIAKFGIVWAPSIPVLLIVLAIAQMGVHLVFFIHLTTAPDNTNNVMALAFGTLIVILVIGGSLWIMANLNANMMPMDEIMKMQR